MNLHFTKMHGLGNDFVIIDTATQAFAGTPEQITEMADRHRGIGFDQLLTITASPTPECAYAYGIWNADGSPAQQCGNGVRCVAAWLRRAERIGTDLLRLQSPSETVEVRCLDDGQVAVNMGEPLFTPARIPFTAPDEADRYNLDVADGLLEIGVVSLGNPHAIIEVEDPEASEWRRVGPALSQHPAFPDGVNAGFVHIEDPTHLQLRVYERGAGWTQACGTGAAAAVAVLRRRGSIDAQVNVQQSGGELLIEWPGPDANLWITGPAQFIYEGEWLAEAQSQPPPQPSSEVPDKTSAISGRNQ